MVLAEFTSSTRRGSARSISRLGVMAEACTTWVGLMLLKQPGESIDLAHVPLHEGDALLIRTKLAQQSLFRRIAIERDHLIPLLSEMQHQIGRNEPGRPGQEDLHSRTSQYVSPGSSQSVSLSQCSARQGEIDIHVLTENQ